jgi:hypothetical protein
MSTTAQSSRAGHDTAEVVHAQQHMSWPWIIGVGVGSIAIFIVGGIWSTHILNSTRAEMQPAGPPPIPKQVDQYEVGIESGVAHIPIDEAMKMYLADQQKKGGQAK